LENAATFPKIQPHDYYYEKRDPQACPIWFEINVSTTIDNFTWYPRRFINAMKSSGFCADCMTVSMVPMSLNFQLSPFSAARNSRVFIVFACGFCS